MTITELAWRLQARRQLVEALLFATSAQWRPGGTLDALRIVEREHVDHDVRELAGIAQDAWTSIPVIAAALDAQLEQMAAEERQAVAR